MQVRLKEPTDQAWVESVLRRCWGGSDIVVRGCVYKAADLPALIAGSQDGLCTFAIESDGMSDELVTIASDDVLGRRHLSCRGDHTPPGATTPSPARFPAIIIGDVAV